MEYKKEDREGSGYLWRESENNAQIIEKGTFTLNGRVRYGGMIKSRNRDGQEKLEFFECIGLIHINDPEKKLNEKTPDRGGKVTIDNEVYKLGCWNKETEQGAPYTSIGFRKFVDNTQEVKKEDIPF
mgnify:FL=1